MLIEATIAEVTLNDQLRYGVQYFLESGSFAGGFNSTGRPRRHRPALVRVRLPGFNFLFTPGGSNITIDALSRITDVKVLSSPSVVVQDNSEAVLTVGEEVPVHDPAAAEHLDRRSATSSTASSTATPVSSCRCGRGSTPTRRFRWRSRRRSAASPIPTPTRTLTPTITQRKITSRVNVQSGQTVVLGGLIQDSEETGRDRIPVLGEIPVVGNLFGTTNNQNIRTELIVFITPRVIRNPEDARDVSEELRSRLLSLRPTQPLGVMPNGHTCRHRAGVRPCHRSRRSSCRCGRGGRS